MKQSQTIKINDLTQQQVPPKEESKTPKATESNFSEVDLGTSSFFRVIGTIQSPSNASNTLNSNMRFSGASMQQITQQSPFNVMPHLNSCRNQAVNVYGVGSAPMTPQDHLHHHNHQIQSKPPNTGIPRQKQSFPYVKTSATSKQGETPATGGSSAQKESAGTQSSKKNASSTTAAAGKRQSSGSKKKSLLMPKQPKRKQ